MGNTNEVVGDYFPNKELVVRVNNYLLIILFDRLSMLILKNSVDDELQYISTKKIQDIKKNYEDMLYYIEQKKVEFEDPISNLHPIQKDYIQFLEKNVYIYEDFDYETECSVELQGNYLVRKLQQIESMYPNPF
mgnify:CR=1 FL=1